MPTPVDPAERPLIQHAERPGRLQPAPRKGRGTVWAIEHRFSRCSRESFDDGWGTLDVGEADAAATRTGLITEVREEQVKSIVASNQSPDTGFDLSVNPYRGCEHGCSYCYARPTHSYLNLSPGVDFETRIVAKMNAAELLRETLAAPSYVPRPLSVGSATDAYQPAERRLRLTRGVIEVLAQSHHAFSLFTKSSLIERDLDLIGPMAAQRLAAVCVTLTTLDADLARRLEPRAAAPHRRLRTIETLARAGVPVGVSLSPIIPFLNEPEIERILQHARDAGAQGASTIVLRLPWEVSPIFQQWLQVHVPDRAARIMARVRDMREGKDNEPRFGLRMTGQGVWAQLIRQRFDKACQRLGLATKAPELDLSRFRRPARDLRQGELF